MDKKKDNYFKFTSEEKKQTYLKEIIGYFETERSEEIGVIAAESILDFFLESLGKEIYKKGIADAKKVLKEKNEEMDAELDFVIGKIN